MLNEQEIREKNLNIIKQEIKKSQYMASILFLNATDTLILINKNINKLLKYTDLPSDQDFINKINELKKPFIEAAKKELDKQRKEMQSTRNFNTYKEFITYLKARGLDLLESEDEQEQSFEDVLKEIDFNYQIPENNYYQNPRIRKLMK
ncbi:MAG: hypothetical protein IJJ63_04020 [Bacilli bacterium]|nr:hypothetical protein [Bacilli bacterium]